MDRVVVVGCWGVGPAYESGIIRFVGFVRFITWMRYLDSLTPVIPFVFDDLGVGEAGVVGEW